MSEERIYDCEKCGERYDSRGWGTWAALPSGGTWLCFGCQRERSKALVAGKPWKL